MLDIEKFYVNIKRDDKDCRVSFFDLEPDEIRALLSSKDFLGCINLLEFVDEVLCGMEEFMMHCFNINMRLMIVYVLDNDFTRLHTNEDKDGTIEQIIKTTMLIKECSKNYDVKLMEIFPYMYMEYDFDDLLHSKGKWDEFVKTKERDKYDTFVEEFKKPYVEKINDWAEEVLQDLNL